MIASIELPYLSTWGRELTKMSNKVALGVRKLKDKREGIPHKPNGLYPSCEWDVKEVKKMVLSKQIAPRWQGSDDEKCSTDKDECPICFQFYPSVNRTECCSQLICTECYLQVKNPKHDSPCPFCCKSFQVTYVGPRPDYVREKERNEEFEILKKQLGKENFERRQRMETSRIESIETVSSETKLLLEKEAERQALRVECEPEFTSQQICNDTRSHMPVSGNNRLYPHAIEEMMVLEAIRTSLNERADSCSQEETTKFALPFGNILF